MACLKYSIISSNIPFSDKIPRSVNNISTCYRVYSFVNDTVQLAQIIKSPHSLHNAPNRADISPHITAMETSNTLTNACIDVDITQGARQPCTMQPVYKNSYFLFLSNYQSARELIFRAPGVARVRQRSSAHGAHVCMSSSSVSRILVCTRNCSTW